MDLLRQLPDLFGIGGDAGRQVFDRGHGQAHLLTSLAGNTIRFARCFGSGHGIARHLLHRGGHLIDRSRRLFDFLALLQQPAGGIFGHRAELFGG
ncbi:hypothetical protein D9M71_836810 [compost metagenome]